MMLLLPFTQFLFGPLPWSVSTGKSNGPKCAADTTFEKGKETPAFWKGAFEKSKEIFEKVLCLREKGIQLITLPADAPHDTTSTRITEFHIAFVYLHFSTVSFWSDEAKQNETVWVGFRW